MNHENMIATTGYGREAARVDTASDRRHLPVIDSIGEELMHLLSRLHQSNAMLEDIADRITGPMPETTGLSSLTTTPNSLSDMVSQISGALGRYECLLARF